MVVLTVFAVATKYYGAGIGARMAGLDKHTGNAIGAGMVSRGEMALVIAQIGATGGILSGKVFGEIVVVIIASTLIAPLMMRPLIKSTVNIKSCLESLRFRQLFKCAYNGSTS